MSQEKLGQILGVSLQQVQKYEKDTNRIGSSRLWAIASALDTRVEYFFQGLEETGNQDEKSLPFKTIMLARKIEAIQNPVIRTQILSLIRACAEGGMGTVNSP